MLRSHSTAGSALRKGRLSNAVFLNLRTASRVIQGQVTLKRSRLWVLAVKSTLTGVAAGPHASVSSKISREICGKRGERIGSEDGRGWERRMREDRRGG
eukprot:3337559-Rhodomonas_salina.1